MPCHDPESNRDGVLVSFRDDFAASFKHRPLSPQLTNPETIEERGCDEENTFHR